MTQPRSNISAPYRVVTATVGADLTEQTGQMPNAFWVDVVASVQFNLVDGSTITLPNASPGHWHAFQFIGVANTGGATVLAGWS